MKRQPIVTPEGIALSFVGGMLVSLAAFLIYGICIGKVTFVWNKHDGRRAPIIIRGHPY